MNNCSLTFLKVIVIAKRIRKIFSVEVRQLIRKYQNMSSHIYDHRTAILQVILELVVQKCIFYNP